MDNDLISREAVWALLDRECPLGISNDDIAEAFRNAPTVDAVEVVRCKDCKHFLEYSPAYEGEVQGADGDCFIRLMHTEYEPQFCAVQKCEFCSFGERNEVRYV